MTALALVRLHDFEAELFVGPSAYEELTETLTRSADGQAVGLLLHELCRLTKTETGREALATWMDRHALEWANSHRTSLAAAIEAVILSNTHAEALGPALVTVLEDDQADSVVQSVAAQRIRLVPLIGDLRERGTTALRRRIDAWIQNHENAKAVVAIPSLWILASEGTHAAFASWLEHAPTEIAWAVAQGALNVASKLSEADREQLTDALLRRLSTQADSTESERVDLRAALLWLSGAIGTRTRLGELTVALATSFVTGKNLEDGAAIRAGRLLVGRIGPAAVAALNDAFGSNKTDFHRFLALISRPDSRTNGLPPRP